MTEHEEPNKGLILYFHRDASGIDCTIGGVSSRHAQCVLVGVVDYTRSEDGKPKLRRLPAECRVFAPSDTRPPVWLVAGKHGADDLFIIPGRVDANEPDSRWWMMGGNYAATSDSRFSELCGGNFAVRVHDRHEG